MAGRLTCCLTVSLTNVKAFLCKLSCKSLLPPTAALENACGFQKKKIILLSNLHYSHYRFGSGILTVHRWLKKGNYRMEEGAHRPIVCSRESL